MCTLLIALFAPPLAEMALKFGPADYFSLMVLGLVASIVLASGSLLHALGMIVLGLLLGLIGTDVNSGTARYSFELPELPTASTSSSSRWACSASARSSPTSRPKATRSVMLTKIAGLMPTREDFKRMVAPILRGTALGSVLGILPGGGAMLSSFAAYSLEKKVSRNAAQFGKGAIEGVAAPEAANNAGAQTSFIPMLTLGIPVESGDGADDRRDDHPGHPARSRAS